MPFEYDAAAACYRYPNGAAVPASRLRAEVARSVAASLGGAADLEALGRESSAALFAASLLGGGPDTAVLPVEEPVTFSSVEKAAACAPAALALFDRALLAASIAAGGKRKKALGQNPDPAVPFGWQPADSETIPSGVCAFDVSLMPSPPPGYDGPGANYQFPQARSEEGGSDLDGVSEDEVSRACAAYGIGSARAIEEVRKALAIGQIADRSKLAEVLMMARVIRDRIEQNPMVEGKAVSEAIGYGSLDSLRNAALTSTGETVGRKRAILVGCQEEPQPMSALIEVRLPDAAFAAGEDVRDWAEFVDLAAPKIDRIEGGWRIVQRLPAYNLGNWREFKLGEATFCVADVRVDCEEMPEAIWERPVLFAAKNPGATGGEADRAWKTGGGGSGGYGSSKSKHDGADADGVGDWQKGHSKAGDEDGFWITTRQGRHVMVKEGKGDQKGELVVLSGNQRGMTMSQAVAANKMAQAQREHGEKFEAARSELAQALHGSTKKTALARVTDAHVAEYLLDKDGWLTKQENVAKHMADVSDYMATHVIDPDDPEVIRVAGKGEKPTKEGDEPKITPKDLKAAAKSGKKVVVSPEQLEKLRDRYRKWEQAMINPDRLEPSMKADVRKSQERARLQAERAAGPWYKRALGKISEWAWNSPVTAFIMKKADETVGGGKSAGGGGFVGGALGAAINVPLKTLTGFSIPLAGVLVEQGLRSLGTVKGFRWIGKSMDWIDKKSEDLDKWTDKTFGKTGGRVIRIAAFAAGTLAPFAMGAALGVGTGVAAAGVPLLVGAGLAVLGKGAMKMTEKVKAGVGVAINKMRERQKRLQELREAKARSQGQGQEVSPAFAAEDEDAALVAAFFAASEGKDVCAGWGDDAEPISAAMVKELGWTQGEYTKNVRLLAQKYAQIMSDFVEKFGRDFAMLDGMLSGKAKMAKPKKKKAGFTAARAEGWCRYDPPVDPSRLGALVEFDGWPCTRQGVRVEFSLAGCEDSDNSLAASFYEGEPRFRVDAFSDGFVRLNSFVAFAEGGKLAEGPAELLHELHGEGLALFSTAVELFPDEWEEHHVPVNEAGRMKRLQLGCEFSSRQARRRAWLSRMEPLVERLRESPACASLDALAQKAAAAFQGACREYAERYGPAVGFSVYGLYEPEATLDVGGIVRVPGLSVTDRVLACAIPALVLARAQAGFADGLFSDHHGELDAALFTQEGSDLHPQQLDDLSELGRRSACVAFWCDFLESKRKGEADFSGVPADLIEQVRRLIPADLGFGPRPRPEQAMQTAEDREADLSRIEEAGREAAGFALERIEESPERGSWGEAVSRARRAAASLSDCYGVEQARAVFAAGIVAHATHPSLCVPAMARTWLDSEGWPKTAAFCENLPSGFLRELGDRVVASLVEGWTGSSASDAEFSALCDREVEIEETPAATVTTVPVEPEAPSSQQRHSWLDARLGRVYSDERQAVHDRLVGNLLGGRVGSEKLARLSVNAPADWPAALGCVPVEQEAVAARLAGFGADDDVAAEAYDVAYGKLLDRAIEEGLPLDVACPPYWSQARFCDVAERLARAGYRVEAVCFMGGGDPESQDALFGSLAEHPDVSTSAVYEDAATFDANEDYDEWETLEAQFAGEKDEGWSPAPKNPTKLRKKNDATGRWMYKNAPTKGGDGSEPQGNNQKVSHRSVNAFKKAASSVQDGGHEKMHHADDAFDKHVKGLSGPQKVALARHVGAGGKLADGDHKKAHEALKTALQSHAIGERKHVPDHPGSGKTEKLKQSTVDAMNAVHKKAHGESQKKGDYKFIGHDKVAKHHADLAKKVGDKQVRALAEHLHPGRKFTSAGEAHAAVKGHIEQSGLGVGHEGDDSKAKKVADAPKGEPKEKKVPVLDSVAQKLKKAKKEDASAVKKETAKAGDHKLDEARKEDAKKPEAAPKQEEEDDDAKHAKLMDKHARRFDAAKKSAESAMNEDDVKKINDEFHKGVEDDHRGHVGDHVAKGSGKGSSYTWASPKDRDKGFDEAKSAGAKKLTHHLLMEHAGLNNKKKD